MMFCDRKCQYKLVGGGVGAEEDETWRRLLSAAAEGTMQPTSKCRWVD